MRGSEQMVSLRWEEDEDGFCLLYVGDRLVGETYPRGDGFRWHCKLTDIRRMETTLEAAKAAVLASVEGELRDAG